MNDLKLGDVDFVGEDGLGRIVGADLDFTLGVGQALGIRGVAGVSFG